MIDSFRGSFSGNLNSSRSHSEIPIGVALEQRSGSGMRIHENPFNSNFGQPVVQGVPTLFVAPGQAAVNFPMYQNNPQLALSIDKFNLERTIRKSAQLFVCVNLCYLFYAAIYIANYTAYLESGNGLTSSGNALSQNTRTACGVLIAMQVLWLLLVFGGVYAIRRFRISLINIYIFGLVICMILNVIGSSFMIAGASDWKYQEKTTVVIAFMLTLLCQVCFVFQASSLSSNMKTYLHRYMSSLN